jgi:hypothetical protein
MTCSARLQTAPKTRRTKRKPKRSPEPNSQGWVWDRVWRYAPAIPSVPPAGGKAGVGGLAVATPVLGGVRRHKTFPHSYRRVGGRYRQSTRQSKLCDNESLHRIELSHEGHLNKVAAATTEVMQWR